MSEDGVERLPEAADRARFETAVLPHLDSAYNLARWLCRDPDEAQDIVQEATLRALRFFASYRGDDARPWYLKIVRNTFLSGHGRRGAGVVVPFSAVEAEDGPSLLDQVPAPDPDPEAAMAVLQDREAMDRMIARLPAEFREVLVLRELEELSYRDIAEVVQIPIGTVMSRLSRARRQLLCWAREGGMAEAGHEL